MPSSSSSSSPSWNFESGIPETELPFSSFHSTPKGIGKVGRGGKKYEARERCRRFVVCMSSRRRTGAKRIPTPFRTFLASISRSCSFLYTHPRCTWGHPLQPSARQTTPTVTRITDSPPEKKHPLSAKMDYVSFVEISSTRSSLVQIGFVSKKIQHRLLYSLRILSFDESKVSARFIRNLFLTFSSLKFSSDASFFIPLRSVQLHNSKWSRVKVYGKTFGQKSGKFVRSTINSIPARSKSLMSFDF